MNNKENSFDKKPNRRLKGSKKTEEYSSGSGFDDERSLIIGRNPVIEALKAGKLIDLIFINSEADPFRLSAEWQRKRVYLSSR